MMRTLEDSIGNRSSSVCFMAIENVWHAGTYECGFLYL